MILHVDLQIIFLKKFLNYFIRVCPHVHIKNYVKFGFRNILMITFYFEKKYLKLKTENNKPCNYKMK